MDLESLTSLAHRKSTTLYFIIDIKSEDEEWRNNIHTVKMLPRNIKHLVCPSYSPPLLEYYEYETTRGLRPAESQFVLLPAERTPLEGARRAHVRGVTESNLT